ncbi:hypothetical protein C8R47DRAFT_1243578 [Mycena vitilis]|nr:hypothetical protein C8R47DRAFT_1243578 [Mycena vitilis]
MSTQADGNFAPATLASPLRKPRPTHISIEALDEFLESHAVNEQLDAVDTGPRRSGRKRPAPNASSSVPSLPPDASLVSPPHSPKKRKTVRKPKDYRIAPQVQITARVGSGASAHSVDVCADPVSPQTPHKVTADKRAGHEDGSGSRGKRGGAVEELPPPPGGRQAPFTVPPVTSPAVSSVADPLAPCQKKEKQDAFKDLKERAMAAGTLEDVASTFRALVTLMHDYRKNAPTAACFDALYAIQSRLDAPHEFPLDAESPESFSAILTKSIAAPIQLMAAQLQSQHKALQSLTKSIDNVKSLRTETFATVAAAPVHPHPSPPKQVPITGTPDERILIRCDGDAPPIFGLPFHDILKQVNATLAPFGLPSITAASRTKDGGLFLVPDSVDCVKSLISSWSDWGPTVFPGSRIVPPAVYSHIQLDGIPHAAAPDLTRLASELMERYPELGPVVGTAVWVNKPPNEAQISATLSTGGKPRTAGSVFIRLESREKVDVAVSLGRLRLAGSVPTVARGFPHLRVVQCWGCLKLGHIRARCKVKETKCGGCGEKSHGAVCTRKDKAAALRQRAMELTTYLNSTSSIPLNQFMAPRLPESNPLETLTDPREGFDIICGQEPNANESNNARELPQYAHIFPDAYQTHRVSVFVKLSTIPAASICPRPDLCKSGDIIVIDFTFGSDKVTLINLYNDSKTRAGVGLLRFVLMHLDPSSKILLVLDSNSHHVAWDRNTKTPTREEDFELHDLLLSFGLLLVTPPDVATHLSGNVIDLGFCSPSLYMAVDATVDPSLCVGSDHLPIHYTLNFDVTVSRSIKFNSDKMDLDAFLGILRNMLDGRPPPVINTPHHSLAERYIICGQSPTCHDVLEVDRCGPGIIYRPMHQAKCGKATAQIHHVDSFTVAVVPHVVLAFPHWETSDQTLSASSTTASTKSYFDIDTSVGNITCHLRCAPWAALSQIAGKTLLKTTLPHWLSRSFLATVHDADSHTPASCMSLQCTQDAWMQRFAIYAGEKQQQQRAWHSAPAASRSSFTCACRWQQTVRVSTGPTT